MSKQDYSRRKPFLSGDADKSLVIDFDNVQIDNVTVYTETSAPATITVDVSIDGESGNWRNIDSFVTAQAYKEYDGTHRFVRVNTVTAVDGTFEITGM